MNAIAKHHKRVLCNGWFYLKNRCTMVIGISLNNPHFYKEESLTRLIELAENNADKVK